MLKLFKSSAAAALALAWLPAAASAPADTLMETTELRPVNVTGSRNHDLHIVGPQLIHTIDAATIASSNAQTSADLLAMDGLLTVQKSQLGGGSPVIRGFEASRVLLVMDNVPLNNLIYRSGHLQNVITVDQSMLEGVDVIYGPGSVIYGSGALGGVVSFRTKAPKLSLDGRTTCSGNAFMRYSSANTETTGHIDVNVGTSRFASLTSLTYGNYGDLRSGRRRNPFLPDGDHYITRPFEVMQDKDGKDVVIYRDNDSRQYGSGYTQYDLMQKFLYRPNNRFSHSLNFQLSNSSDVPRYDRLTQIKGDAPQYAEWYYGPQFRLMAAYTLDTRKWLGADAFSMTVAYQNLMESRNNRSLNNKKLRTQHERVNTVTVNTDWLRHLSGRNEIRAGIDLLLGFVRSTAWRRNIFTGETEPTATRYPDGSNHMHSFDFYAMHKAHLSSSLVLTDGIRLGYSTLRSTFVSDEFYFLASTLRKIQQDNFTYSANAGLAYTFNPDWRLSLALALGNYVPNIDDVAKIFDSTQGAVVVPNPDLKPEQVLGAELNLTRLRTGNLLWETSFFGSYIFNDICLARASFNGHDHLEYDGVDSEVYRNENARRAYVLGFTSHLDWLIWKGIRADATLTYTYGEITRGVRDDKGADVRTPLDHVPPLFGRVGLSWRPESDRMSVELYSLFNGKKPLSRYNLDGEDNIAYATVNGKKGEGMPAWFTLNLRASWRLNSYVTLQGALENILDTRYRTFGSGINAPGRNIVVALRTSF